MRMPDSWYNPPEPAECCPDWGSHEWLREDDPNHDSDACIAEQAEADAERRADEDREWAKISRDEDRY